MVKLMCEEDRTNLVHDRMGRSKEQSEDQIGASTGDGVDGKWKTGRNSADFRGINSDHRLEGSKRQRRAPQAERVLELVQNPSSRERWVRQQELDLLREENEGLLAGNIDGTVERLRFDLQREKAKTLEAEKRLDRLKQQYTIKVARFVEAVDRALGYKVSFASDTRVRIEGDGRVIVVDTSAGKSSGHRRGE